MAHHHHQGAATPRDRLITVEERDSRTGQLVSRYTQGRLLGKGGFAKCYEATNCSTGEVFALKVIDKKSLTKPKTMQKLKSEIKIHSSLRHKHVVGFKRYFEDANYVYILLELCEGQTLMEHSKRKRRFTEPEASYLLWQCLLALRYMHRLGVIHRDLKLGNIMLTDRMEVKVGDFGLAARLDFEGERKRTVCGTPNYIAPEILDGNHRGHSFEVDVWTIGVIMYTLLVGHPPFETSDVKATYRRIKAVSYTFPPDLRLSSEARDLIARILQASPESRPSLEQLENDRWFRTHPPTQLAPLSLFTPGSAQYHAHQQRLSDAQGRGDSYYNEEWARPRRRDSRSPQRGLQPSPGYDPHRNASQRTASAAGCAKHTPVVAPSARARSSSTTRSGAQLKENRAPAAGDYDAGRGSSPCIVGSGGTGHYRPVTDVSPRTAAPYCSPSQPRAAALAPPQFASASPRHVPVGGDLLPLRGASVSPSPAAAPGLTTPQHLYSQSPAHRQDYYASPGAAGAPTQATTAPTVGHSGGTSVAAPCHRDVERAETAPAPLPPPRVDHTPRGASAERSDPYGLRGHAAQPTPPGSLAAQQRRASAERCGSAPQGHREQPRRAGSAGRPGSAEGLRRAPHTAHEGDDDNQNLTAMHQHLEQTLLGEAPPEVPPDPQLPGPKLWVTDYVDFTAKYGLAYRLSSGQIGVHFNDSTKMVWDYDSGNIEYISRQKSTGTDGQVVVADNTQSVKVDNFPDTLNKKVTLVKYFRAYLIKAKGRTPKEGQQEVITCSRAADTASAPPQPSRMVYVKRWLKTDHAAIFRLSNKSVQVCFFDHTEIILSSEARLVTYTDPSGRRSTFSLSSMISHPQQEIAQRLKYTKDIICKLINVNGEQH